MGRSTCWAGKRTALGADTSYFRDSDISVDNQPLEDIEQ